MPAAFKDGDEPQRMVLLGGHVTESTRTRFAELARREGKSSAALLRDLVTRATSGQMPEAEGSGSAHKLMLRLRTAPRAALLEQAKARRTTPTGWATALLEAALLGSNRPVWGKREAEELRALYLDLKAIERTVSEPDTLDAVRRSLLRVANALTGLGPKPR